MWNDHPTLIVAPTFFWKENNNLTPTAAPAAVLALQNSESKFSYLLRVLSKIK